MMTVDMLRSIVGWCAVINIGIMLWWFLMLMFAHDFIYRMHTRWFKLSAETFDAIHYGGVAFYKIIVITFNIIPYFALRIIT